MAKQDEKEPKDYEKNLKPKQLKIDTKEGEKEFCSPPCSLPEFDSDFDD